MLRTQPYSAQQVQWPPRGRHILAQFDDQSVVVYQAYGLDIGTFAVAHGIMGGNFSYSRMSWIKPNLLWMMYRSGWGTKPGQEMILALRIRRTFFDGILSQAVESTYSEACGTRSDWEGALARSSVRLQWDPDHDPSGRPVERRALQLGLRGSVLEDFGKRQLLEVLDMSAFVAEQRARLHEGGSSALLTPSEDVYVPADRAVAERVRLELGPAHEARS